MPKDKSHKDFIIHDVNVAYPVGEDPVPLTPECLVDQAIPGITTIIYYGADVEPIIAVNPKEPSRIVAAWQNDRINNGGSLEIGIAYSHNGGKTWKHSVVPFQRCLGGPTNRVSDEWLSYSADGRRVFLTAAVFNSVPLDLPNDIQ